jgi:hypothetical protein
MSTETILTIVCGIAFSLVIFLWVEGIDYMKKNHPDYKGEDLLDEDNDDDEINSFYNQMDKEVHQNNGNLNK